MQRLDIHYPLTSSNISVNRFQCEQETMEEHGALDKQKVGSVTDDSNDERIHSHDFVPEQKPNVVPSSWKPFGCETCGKRFTLRGSLKTHEKLHGFRPTYSCDVCGKTFKVAAGLKSHASLHSGQKPFHCDICGKSFTLKGSLKTHSALHSTVRESFPCYVCGKTYKGRASLKSHYAMHTDRKSFMCEVQAPQRAPSSHIPVGEGNSMANVKPDMRGHQVASFDFWHRFPQLFHGYDIAEGVAANQPVVTRECTKKEMYNISCESSGLSMLTASHSDDVAFYIGQSLVHQYGRSKPPLSARSRPFSCEVCGKRFTLRGSLKTHEKLHSFRQSYHCHVCGKTFKVEGGLKSHSVLHTNHRPFLCVVCGRGFTLKGSLKTHLTLHSVHRASYPCDICGKTYKGKASYDSHRAQHLGQSLYPCEVCGKNFTLKGSLKLHSLLHSGLRPYTCYVCGMSFTIRSHLTRHFQMHNPL